jgi:hypothetical protein
VLTLLCSWACEWGERVGVSACREGDHGVLERKCPLQGSLRQPKTLQAIMRENTIRLPQSPQKSSQKHKLRPHAAFQHQNTRLPSCAPLHRVSFGVEGKPSLLLTRHECTGSALLKETPLAKHPSSVLFLPPSSTLQPFPPNLFIHEPKSSQRLPNTSLIAKA